MRLVPGWRRPKPEVETEVELPARGRSRWRRFWQIGVAALAAVIVLWSALRDTSPVGHFASARGHDEFMSAYQRAMRDMPDPDATLDLRTSFGLVRMYRFGGANPEQAPLVLLPGWAAGSPMWADNLPSLLRLRTVYTVDLLGQPGASLQNRPIENAADQANWLHQALALLPHPAIHLLGMSNGGWTAMNLAIHEPQKIKSVTVLDPVMTFADISLGVVVRSIPVSVRWTPKSWRDSFNSWTANGAPVEDVPVADMIESGMKNYALKLPTPTRFSAQQLSGLDMPVLAIIAGASVMHDPDAAAHYAKENLKRGTVLTYDGASHAISGEQPDRIAADVGRFLDEVS